MLFRLGGVDVSFDFYGSWTGHEFFDDAQFLSWDYELSSSFLFILSSDRIQDRTGPYNTGLPQFGQAAVWGAAIVFHSWGRICCLRNAGLAFGHETKDV